MNLLMLVTVESSAEKTVRRSYNIDRMEEADALWNLQVNNDSELSIWCTPTDGIPVPSHRHFLADHRLKKQLPLIELGESQLCVPSHWRLLDRRDVTSGSCGAFDGLCDWWEEMPLTFCCISLKLAGDCLWIARQTLETMNDEWCRGQTPVSIHRGTWTLALTDQTRVITIDVPMMIQ